LRRFFARAFVSVASAGLLAAIAPAPASAQMPDTFENLEVIPKDISKEQMTAIMQGFSAALGVRCTFCHVGEPPKIDFMSDDKDEKKAARAMWKMVESINKDIAQLGSTDEEAQVTCYTCHRGAEHPPQALSAVLARTALTKGAQAAVDQYSKLKEEKLEAGQYDFRVQSLTSAAGQLRRQNKPDEALALLKNAASLFPKSADAAATYGSALAESEDKAAAEAELTRALQLDPTNRMAKGALDRLKSGGQPPAPQR
jgi:tetratricopeptide (TPR) repeat protein